jgi:hypothetical protein
MYRKIPVDLMEGTRRGSVLSYMASFAMLFLFLLETRAYFEKLYVYFTERALVKSSLRAFSIFIYVIIMDPHPHPFASPLNDFSSSTLPFVQIRDGSCSRFQYGASGSFEL